MAWPFNRRRRLSHGTELFPEEILVDAQNLPRFETDRLEGRIHRPISRTAIIILGVVFGLVGSTFAYKAYSLQIMHGDEYGEISENNRLNHALLFADRGIIYDRTGEKLAWNVPPDDNQDFALRAYIPKPGFGHLLGYVKYPKKDKAGFYYGTEFEGFGGIEERFDGDLEGEHGLKIIETDAVGNVTSQNAIQPPDAGKSVTISVDARLQNILYESIRDLADEVGFAGGAGAMMDIHTGEVIAMVSYPEIDSAVMTDGKDEDTISAYFQDALNPFLDRPIDGLYTPGSIVKPYMAIAALNEGVIDPTTKIVSRGTLSVPNPYDPSNPSLFNDWKAHGPVDVKEAIAVSSNIYFYVVGGGYEDQPGLGIARIGAYMHKFGFGTPFVDKFFGTHTGTVPSIEWKAKTFPDDPWRLGDTYFTSIGQYGFQVTTMQVLRALSAIANKGTLIEPTIVKDDRSNERVAIEGIDKKWFDVVHEGMRTGALFGTAKALNVDYMDFAGKTGTAELGATKQKVNSWVTGFYPYSNPQYAFVVTMESGDRSNLVGATIAARRFFDRVLLEAPEYLEK